MDLFDDVMASNKRFNLSSHNKADKLVERFGKRTQPINQYQSAYGPNQQLRGYFYSFVDYSSALHLS
jgi:hypothetical protein